MEIRDGRPVPGDLQRAEAWFKRTEGHANDLGVLRGGTAG